jgi:hypothetical protein
MTEEASSAHEPKPTPILTYETIAGREVAVIRPLPRDSHEKQKAVASNNLENRLREPRITPEGFRIRGQNETADILALYSLEGEPIDEVESRLKSGENYRYLAPNDNLLAILANDNDAVAALKKKDGSQLTHEDLYQATLELTLAVSHALNHDIANFIYDDGQNRLQVDCRVGNSASISAARIPKDISNPHRSPPLNILNVASHISFNVINSANGAHVNLNLHALQWIAFGFYEGNVRFRSDPKEVAEALGVVAVADDDPVVQLVKDRDKEVHITSLDQLNRAITRFGGDVFKRPNISVDPTTPAMVFELVKAAEKYNLSLTEVAERFPIPDIGAQPLKVEQWRSYSKECINTEMLRKLADLSKASPDYAKQLLTHISKLELDSAWPGFGVKLVDSIIEIYRSRASHLLKDPVVSRLDIFKRFRTRQKGEKTENETELSRLKEVLLSLMGKLEDKGVLWEQISGGKANVRIDRETGALRPIVADEMIRFLDEAEQIQ